MDAWLKKRYNFNAFSTRDNDELFCFKVVRTFFLFMNSFFFFIHMEPLCQYLHMVPFVFQNVTQ